MKNKILFLLLIFFNISFLNVQADGTTLLPLPQKCRWSGRVVTLKTVSVNTPLFEKEFETLLHDKGLKVCKDAKYSIEARMVKAIPGTVRNEEEAYRLKVGTDKINIDAITERGLFWALQTLRQLMDCRNGKVTVACGEVVDWPAFPVRGFMQDVGRSYISMDELKREIAKLSEYKINLFHWHLTENQAWRLQSLAFPELNAADNMTRMKGKFYTLEEARELETFCNEHGMLLVPEIDMPGHSEAFERTFGCTMQSSRGIEILKVLLKEACSVFKSPYIHIGTDEVKFTNPDFVPEMVRYIRSLGKKVISWTPGWKYEPGEIDMMQMWSGFAKPTKGIPAIDSRYHYLNHFDTFGDIIALYNSRIGGVENSGDSIKGAVMAVWNDRLLDSEEKIITENNFYPNMLAFAERSWRGGGTEYFDKNGTILPVDTTDAVFRQFADFERRLLWHKRHNFTGCPFPYFRQTDVLWRITSAYPNGGNLSEVFAPEKEFGPGGSERGELLNTSLARGAGIYLRHVWGSMIPSFFKQPKENSTAYAYTYVYSPKEQKAGLLAEFQNYSRSESDLTPPVECWDYKGSRLFLNDKEVAAPEWTCRTAVRDNERPLGNENMVSRPPIEVQLHKGWNKVFVKLPVGKFSTPEVRLVKWMFSVLFVTPDGSEALPGIVYSPDKTL